MARYPSNYPLPTRDPYAFAVDMGVARTAMESGNVRQRRTYPSMPHAFSLQFVVPREDVDGWLRWVNNNAYDWFELPLVNYITTGLPNCAAYCFARFTSDLAARAMTQKHFAFSVDAELQPGQVNNNFGRTLWVVGGTPSAPSPIWVIGGEPDAPSPDWVTPFN